jgi:MFS family permease
MFGKLAAVRLNRDFLKLWSGQALSLLGTAVTQLALPTAAIKLLGAGAFEVGMLGMLQYLAFPTLGLFAGVWVDRLAKRPTMVVCDAMRLLVIASIPIAWFMGALTIWHLYIAALVLGICSVFFDVSFQAYVPALLPRELLVSANSLEETSVRSSQMAGPGLAGLLIQAFTAAPALLVDAASYAVSVATLLWIRAPEPLRSAQPSGHFRHELREGIDVVMRNPALRLMVGSTATSNLGSEIVITVFLVYAYRSVHLTPGELGLVLAGGGAGGVLGSIVAARAAARFSLGPTLTLAMSLFVFALLIPAAGATTYPVILLSAIWFVLQVGGSVYNVNSTSYRQAAVPLRLQGRATAAIRAIVWGTIPIGAAAGGLLGTYVGLVPAIYIGSAIAAASVIWLLAGPVRLKALPVTSAAD